MAKYRETVTLTREFEGGSKIDGVFDSCNRVVHQMAEGYDFKVVRHAVINTDVAGGVPPTRAEGHE